MNTAPGVHPAVDAVLHPLANALDTALIALELSCCELRLAIAWVQGQHTDHYTDERSAYEARMGSCLYSTTNVWQDITEAFALLSHELSKLPVPVMESEHRTRSLSDMIRRIQRSTSAAKGILDAQPSWHEQKRSEARRQQFRDRMATAPQRTTSEHTDGTATGSKRPAAANFSEEPVSKVRCFEAPPTAVKTSSSKVKTARLSQQAMQRASQSEPKPSRPSHSVDKWLETLHVDSASAKQFYEEHMRKAKYADLTAEVEARFAAERQRLVEKYSDAKRKRLSDVEDPAAQTPDNAKKRRTASMTASATGPHKRSGSTSGHRNSKRIKLG